MPVTYSFDAARNAVFGTLADPVTIEEWGAALTGMFRHCDEAEAWLVAEP